MNNSAIKSVLVASVALSFYTTSQIHKMSVAIFEIIKKPPQGEIKARVSLVCPSCGRSFNAFTQSEVGEVISEATRHGRNFAARHGGDCSHYPKIVTNQYFPIDELKRE